MNQSREPALLTIDEGLFCRLLEGPGRVRVHVVMLEQYYLPFVSFCPEHGLPPVEYGVIVRARSDLLAAKTVAALEVLLRDIGGESCSLEFHPPGCPDHTDGGARHAPARAPSRRRASATQQGEPANDVAHRRSCHEEKPVKAA